MDCDVVGYEPEVLPRPLPKGRPGARAPGDGLSRSYQQSPSLTLRVRKTFGFVKPSGSYSKRATLKIESRSSA